ncbi:MAG: hypothetical protein QM661_04120 [Solimonas sp.]
MRVVTKTSAVLSVAAAPVASVLVLSSAAATCVAGVPATLVAPPLVASLIGDVVVTGATADVSVGVPAATSVPFATAPAFAATASVLPNRNAAADMRERANGRRNGAGVACSGREGKTDARAFITIDAPKAQAQISGGRTGLNPMRAVRGSKEQAGSRDPFAISRPARDGAGCPARLRCLIRQIFAVVVISSFRMGIYTPARSGTSAAAENETRHAAA